MVDIISMQDKELIKKERISTSDIVVQLYVCKIIVFLFFLELKCDRINNIVILLVIGCTGTICLFYCGLRTDVFWPVIHFCTYRDECIKIRNLAVGPSLGLMSWRKSRKNKLYRVVYTHKNKWKISPRTTTFGRIITIKYPTTTTQLTMSMQLISGTDKISEIPL